MTSGTGTSRSVFGLWDDHLRSGGCIERAEDAFASKECSQRIRCFLFLPDSRRNLRSTRGQQVSRLQDRIWIAPIILSGGLLGNEIAGPDKHAKRTRITLRRPKTECKTARCPTL